MSRLLGRWWIHALGYLLLLVVVAPFVDWDVPFTPDEGLYGEQVEALQEGSWAWDYPAAHIDPKGEWFPLVNAEVREGAYFPYLRHPAYVSLLWGAETLGGEVVGLHVIALVGAVGAAVAAWFLAREVGAPPAVAFWLAALGPLVVNAHVIWAHTLSAALAGGAAVAALRLWRRWSPGAAIGLAVALGAGVLVRAEGFLFALAVGLVLSVAVLRARGVPAAVRAGAPALAAPVAFLAERWWIGEIVTGAGASGTGSVRGVRQTAGSYLEGRVKGAWRLLAETSDAVEASQTVGVLALALVLLGAVVIRRRMAGHEQMGPLLVAAGAVVLVVRFAIDSSEAMGGLLAAWPVLIVALVLLRREELTGGVAVLLAVVGVFTTAVLLTQYEVAGGLEWGARFLAPTWPLLAVVVAVVLARAVGRVPSLAVPVVALAVVPAVGGLVMLDQKAQHDEAVVASAVDPGSDVIVTHDRLMPRYGWRVDPPGGWMLVDLDHLEDLRDVLERLGAAGVEPVTVVQPLFSAPEVVGEYDPDDVRDVSTPVGIDFGWGVWVVDP